MLDLKSVTEGLQQGADGIWLAPTQHDISHPEECQDWYLSVEDKSYWFQHRAACITSSVRMFPSDGLIFDVGGGSGHVSLAMNQAGFPTVLVEPSVSAARCARTRGVENVICATLQDSGIHPESAAGIGMFDVLEHIDDDEGFLRHTHRVLRSDGRLYLTVPAFGWLWSNYDPFVGHYRRYTLSHLRGLLQRCGFGVEYASYLFAPLPLPIFLLRSLPSALGMGKQDLERFQREHASEPSLKVRLLRKVLRWERQRIESGKTLAVGSSCLVVARKLDDSTKNASADYAARAA